MSGAGGRVDDKPGGNGAEGLREEVGAACEGQLATDELVDLGDDEKMDRMAAPQPAHAPRALHIVAPGHVLAEGLDGARVEGAEEGQVGTSRVDLVVQGEQALRRDAAPAGVVA